MTQKVRRLLRKVVLAPCLMMVTTMITTMSFAQIGQPIDTLLSQLSNYDIAERITGYVADKKFTFKAEERGGVVYSLTGSGLLDDGNITFVGDLIAASTGFGENISTPIQTFLKDRIGELSGKGDAPLQIEQFNWMVNVTGEKKPYKLNFTLTLTEIPLESFPTDVYSMGPADAKYVIREFSDFQCPYCARFVTGTFAEIKEQLLSRDDVRFEFHHFPLVSIHPNAQPAAEASECVVASNTPEDFWPYHDALFERQQAWQALPDASSYFVRLAQDIGLKTDGLAECIAERTYGQKIINAYEAGGKLGVQGTPAVFINGYKVGDFTKIENYLAVIDLIDKFAAEE
ncbi:MAG: DsbA family protein [Trueperaceae bacterium]